MWIQQFQIFMKLNLNLVLTEETYYENQREAFKWIDEHGDKEQEYSILPIITFDNNAKQ